VEPQTRMRLPGFSTSSLTTLFSWIMIAGSDTRSARKLGIGSKKGSHGHLFQCGSAWTPQARWSQHGTSSRMLEH
jgi:hypothetical protein